MSTFNGDFKDALPYEELTKKMLRLRGHSISEPPAFKPGCHPPDLFVDGRSMDVKHDIMSSSTGNVCIEEASIHADYLVFYLDADGSIHYVNTQGLKEKLNNLCSTYDCRRAAHVGDSTNSNPAWIISVRMFAKKISSYQVKDKEWIADYNKLKGK